MCGRFKLENPQLAFDYIQALPTFEVRRRYNIAPTQKIPVLAAPGAVREMRWGIVPSWAKGSQILVNARSESIREKRSFRKSFTERRCLVPADGFYEWTKAAKRPHLFTLGENTPFVIGGFWDEPQEAQKDELPRCCLITTAANAVLLPIHDRMPVIVRKEDWEEWLEPGELTDEAFTRFTAPHAAKEMHAVEVSLIVNSAREDSQKCIEPAQPVLKL